MNFPSKLIESAVAQFEKLPGIGKKTALRLVLHLLKQNKDYTQSFSDAILKMRNEITFCKQCHNVSDGELCNICANPQRNQQTVCVVESMREVIAFESTGQYQGTYHVLGGVISPIEGIGPGDLHIASLIERAPKISEIIMALNPTVEGDTTVFFISKKLKDFPLKITTLARGISHGSELEYIDDITLARSLATRTVYEEAAMQNN